MYLMLKNTLTLSPLGVTLVLEMRTNKMNKELIVTEPRRVKIGKQVIDAVLRIFIMEDDCAPDFDYGDAKENAKEMRRFESGELLNLYIQVTVSFEGIEGSDGLGGCFIRSQHVTQDVLDTVNSNDMAILADEHLVNEIQNMAKALAPFVSG